MDVSLPEETTKAAERIDLSSAIPEDFAKIAHPAIRRLAERVARQRREGKDGVPLDPSHVEDEDRIFANGI